MAHHKSAPPRRQLSIDFDRVERGHILKHAVLPDQPGVSALMMKSVLVAIDWHARYKREAYVSQETIRKQAGCKSRRTVIRAVKALQSLSLLIVERKPTPDGEYTNHYVIVWNELNLLCGGYMVTREGDTAARECDTVAREGDTVARECDTVPHKPPSNAQLNTTTNTSWLGVEEKLKRIGTDCPKKMIDLATTRGYKPEEVFAAIEEFINNPALKTPGIIMWWIKSDRLRDHITKTVTTRKRNLQQEIDRLRFALYRKLRGTMPQEELEAMIDREITKLEESHASPAGT